MSTTGPVPEQDAGSSNTPTAPVPPTAVKPKNESPLWSESRKVIVGWTIALVLTPVSVYVSSYVTDRYKAPRPSIEYISTNPWRLVNSPDENFVKEIGGNPFLLAALRDDLAMRMEALNKPDVCTGWLDGEDWNDDCLAVYKSVTNSTHAQLQLIISELKRGIQPKSLSTQHQGTDSLTQLLNRPDKLNETLQADEITTKFREELDRISKLPQLRSGVVSFTAGVLNQGDSDGVVFSRGILKFNGKSMDVYCDKYVPIRSHSFEEVEFSTNSYNDAQEQVHNEWITTVKSNKNIPYRLEITFSNRAEGIDSALGPDSLSAQ